MAGSYPDVPGHRFGYDRDGTVVKLYRPSGGVVTDVAASDVRSMNSESGSYRVPAPGGAVVMHVDWFFPSPRDIAGLFLAYTRDHSGRVDAVEWSADASSPSSGIWTSFGYLPAAGGAVNPDYRSSIAAVSATAAKAVRIRGVGSDPTNFDQLYIAAFHMYGSYTSRLRIWNPTSDVEVGGAALDYADVAPGTNAVKQFRVKNTHSQTAHGVVLTCETLTDATPTLPPQFTFSDGGLYATSLDIGDLAPGAISDVITIQRDTPNSAQSGLWAPRIVAQAGSWS